MKKLISAIVATVALVAMTAAIASAAYTIRAAASGAGAVTNGMTLTTTSTKAGAQMKPDGPTTDGYIAIVNPGVSAADLTWESIYATAYNADATEWNFAAWVEDPAVNTDLTFNLWGANAAQVAELKGQTWSVTVDGKEVGTFVWDDAHVTKANPMFSYTFSNTESIVGLNNAALIRLSEATTPEVPEPATMVAMLTGVAGLGSFVIRRKK